MPRIRISRRWAMAASVACLLLAAFLFLGAPPGPNPTAAVVAEFHELVILGKRSNDRTFHVTYVKDDSENREALQPEQAKRQKLAQASPNDEAMLYVRNGRQFVYAWKAANGDDCLNGSDGQSSSWAIRAGKRIDVQPDPMHMTGGLPGGNYLAPILTFFDGQEKMLVADYNLELRHPTKTTNVLVAMKKPDTKQGPRRIEISFAPSSRQISEMKIWPETYDHRKTNYTLIQIVNDQPLDHDWFRNEFHLRPPATGAAD